MTATSLRAWAWAHQWSSLVCTLFVLILCLTGLPLIFHHEIGRFTGTTIEAPPMPEGTSVASMDAVIAAAQRVHPARYVQYVSRGPDETGLWTSSCSPACRANCSSGSWACSSS